MFLSYSFYTVLNGCISNVNTKEYAHANPTGVFLGYRCTSWHNDDGVMTGRGGGGGGALLVIFTLILDPQKDVKRLRLYCILYLSSTYTTACNQLGDGLQPIPLTVYTRTLGWGIFGDF